LCYKGGEGKKADDIWRGAAQYIKEGERGEENLSWVLGNDTGEFLKTLDEK